eukprot:CAMPEP_0173385766 /NCGR_PEP_ID=MMETSP1356-20130122/8370_1 /TAXON_ID=77927 ORGANISM="Hemiselmis virescens, Strain PCC157" /NCGR_SAMPLE_ID=MMETSP1356 /ASSEMBLY_ACC=CAM_ASM_000847 /LENGTH=134 /DNA_ID=CAMNT_0014341707 /DNA_START=217 /DNA_END=618 /DNA_ORIENTATION=-
MASTAVAEPGGRDPRILAEEKAREGSMEDEDDDKLPSPTHFHEPIIFRKASADPDGSPAFASSPGESPPLFNQLRSATASLRRGQHHHDQQGSPHLATVTTNYARTEAPEHIPGLWSASTRGIQGHGVAHCEQE